MFDLTKEVGIVEVAITGALILVAMWICVWLIKKSK